MVTAFLKHKPGSLRKRGFTLIELMVTITIIVLVTGIVLVQYSSFNSSVILTSQAYQVAFDLRETQSLAISSRGAGVEFREEYGLYFNSGTSLKNQYVLFQDSGTTKPAAYASDEAIGSPTNIDPRYEISRMCVSTAAINVCPETPTATTPNVTALSISFHRPNFDAAFSSSPVLANAQTALIYITSITEPTASRIVRVSASGQISVEKP